MIFLYKAFNFIIFNIETDTDSDNVNVLADNAKTTNRDGTNDVSELHETNSIFTTYKWSLNKKVFKTLIAVKILEERGINCVKLHIQIIN